MKNKHRRPTNRTCSLGMIIYLRQSKELFAIPVQIPSEGSAFLLLSISCHICLVSVQVGCRAHKCFSSFSTAGTITSDQYFKLSTKTPEHQVKKNILYCFLNKNIICNMNLLRFHHICYLHFRPTMHSTFRWFICVFLCVRKLNFSLLFSVYNGSSFSIEYLAAVLTVYKEIKSFVEVKKIKYMKAKIGDCLDSPKQLRLLTCQC